MRADREYQAKHPDAGNPFLYGPPGTPKSELIRDINNGRSWRWTPRGQRIITTLLVVGSLAVLLGCWLLGTWLLGPS